LSDLLRTPCRKQRLYRSARISLFNGIVRLLTAMLTKLWTLRLGSF